MNEFYDIYDVYNPASYRGGSLFINKFGNFANGTLNILNKTPRSFYWNRKNMTKATFRMMTIVNLNFAIYFIVFCFVLFLQFPRPFDGKLEDYLLNDEHHEINRFNRYNTLLFYNCRDMFNFSLKMSNGTSWGYIIKDNMFDGMVGALQNRTIDFGGSPILTRGDRLPFIDYGIKTWTFK